MTTEAPKKTWQERWGKEHNRRRSERYHSDPAYKERVRSSARERRRASESATLEAKDCSDNLAILNTLGEMREVTIGGATREARTFTTEELAEALHYNPQVIYRWYQKDQVPAPVLDALVGTRSFGRATGTHPMKVFVIDEVHVILTELAEHQKVYRYFRKDHADRIERIQSRIAHVRKEQGIV